MADGESAEGEEDHIAIEAQHQTVSNNLYKFRGQESERPKTSNGNHRINSGMNEEKVSHIERINQY